MTERRTRGKKPEYQMNIAKERIDILLGLADKELKGHPERTKRYVELARKIGTRYNIRLDKEQKRTFCKSCNIILKQGVTSKQRIEDGKIVIKCLECNKIYRYPFKKREEK